MAKAQMTASEMQALYQSLTQESDARDRAAVQAVEDSRIPSFWKRALLGNFAYDQFPKDAAMIPALNPPKPNPMIDIAYEQGHRGVRPMPPLAGPSLMPAAATEQPPAQYIGLQGMAQGIPSGSPSSADYVDPNSYAAKYAGANTASPGYQAPQKNSWWNRGAASDTDTYRKLYTER